jgi:hypothetical protein
MTRVKKPTGLLRYASPGWFEAAKPWRIARPRTLIYPGILLAIGVALFAFGARAARPQVTLLRGTGAPFERQGDQIVNQIRLKIENRGSDSRRYHLALEGAPGVRLIAPMNPLTVPGGEQRVTSLFALAEPARFQNGELDAALRVRDDVDFDVTLRCRLLGPEATAGVVR